jgi:hypothetical protein
MALTKKCGRGKIYRAGYTRKLGRGKTVRIAGKCIRSQSRYTSKVKVNRTRLRGYRKSKRALRSCPSGYIKRAAFVRYTKKGKHSLVPEQCIRNIGAPGKGYSRGGPGIGPLRKGELAKYGYKNIQQLGERERHAALEKAIKAYGSLGVWRKLNAVAVYTRRIAPGASRIFKADMDWVRSKYGLKAF